MYYNEILNVLELKIMVAKEIDPAFNVNNYMFVLGIDIITELVPDIEVEFEQGPLISKLFGITVCIDYNDKKSLKLYKEV